MKLKTVAVLVVLSGAAIAVFAFAPIVYSPARIVHCNPLYGNDGNLTLGGCWKGLVSAYESPSCAVLGIGAARDNWTAGFGVWSYHIGCTSKEIYIP